eukprot:2208625-Rhodomonas_salina.1
MRTLAFRRLAYLAATYLPSYLPPELPTLATYPRYLARTSHRRQACGNAPSTAAARACAQSAPIQTQSRGQADPRERKTTKAQKTKSRWESNVFEKLLELDHGLGLHDGALGLVELLLAHRLELVDVADQLRLPALAVQLAVVDHQHHIAQELRLRLVQPLVVPDPDDVEVDRLLDNLP